MHHSPFPRLRGSLALLLPLVALGVACEAEVEPIDVSISAECEWTNDIHCLLPWPSNRWLEDDSTTESGKRLAYPEEAIPKNKDDDPFDVEPYRHRDGFSPTSSILTSFHTPVDV